MRIENNKAVFTLSFKMQADTFKPSFKCITATCFLLAC